MIDLKFLLSQPVYLCSRAEMFTFYSRVTDHVNSQGHNSACHQYKFTAVVFLNLNT